MSAASLSIRRRLLVMLISTLLVVWLVVLLLVYRAAEHEVQEVFDADLARSARILQTLLLHEVEEEKETVENVHLVVNELGVDGLARYPRLAEILRGYSREEARERLELVSTAQEAGHRYGGGLMFAARYGDGSFMLHDSASADLPPTPSGYSDVRLNGHNWRIYSLTQEETGFTVQVGERHVFRAELVRYITRNTLMPLLIALPILALLIWAVVGRALSPLQHVAREVSTRAPFALDPIDDSGAPREIHGLVAALNHLFERVRNTLARERQFTADAAHELRTPLAALKTHLQVARNASAETATRASLDKALAGVDRATHSVEQLLLLARADAQQAREMVSGEVDLRLIAASVVSALSQYAYERDIDLGVEAAGKVIVHGDETALQLMLRNLVDNALRYTPAGGTVTVEVSGDGQKAVLRVLDDGRGIPAAERALVFNRFHRGSGEQAAGTSGSGLGLSIVQRIARLHGASVALGDGLHGRGLGITVTLPVQ